MENFKALIARTISLPLAGDRTCDLFVLHLYPHPLPRSQSGGLPELDVQLQVLPYQFINDIRGFKSRPDPEQDGDNASNLVPEEGLALDRQDAHGVRVGSLTPER